MFDTNKPSIDDDQETYISERTSVPSANKRVSFSQSIYPTKDPHSLQYFYNQLPENGVPLATQYKQEKKLKKPYRKAPPGQGTLVSIPERPPEFNENYYPYTYYSQLRFPEKPKLYHQTIDGQMVPNESLDLSQYIHEPNPSKKRRHHKKSHHKSTKHQHNTEKQIFETVSPIKDNTNIETKADNKLTDLPSQSLSPNIKSKHHRHHHNHHHHHTHSPEKEYIDAEFKVVDVSFKKSDPSPFFARPKNPFTLPPPNIYNPSSYLPPIPQAHYHSQLLNTNWQDPPQPSLPTKNRSLDFYDRYLNTIIRDKLTTDN